MRIWVAALVMLWVMSPAYCGAVEPANIEKNLVVQVLESVQQNRFLPVLSSQWGEQLDISMAYRVQRQAILQRLGVESPAGFKAGLTSNAGQRKFHVDEPVAGVLLPEGELKAQAGIYHVKRMDFLRPMLELEVGFRLKAPVSKPVMDVASLRRLVAKVYPVVELPDLGFDNLSVVKGADLVANNVVAKQFIAGVGMSPDSLDLNGLHTRLSRRGEVILQGRGSDTMGDQWEALLWLVNKVVAQGWTISPGQLLITGVTGKMAPATTGKYIADFSTLGQISLTVD